jgi:hypothetical protein
MGRPRRPEVTAKDICGLKYFKLLRPILDRLHDAGTERDRAGNRRLFFDHYGSLLLLYFFNPILTSLRAIQQASGLTNVQKRLGCARASLGALSEAGHVFDADLLRPVIGELASQALPIHDGREAEALRGLTAVDGSLLPALPKMAWALWLDKERAAKLHLQFEVFTGVPLAAKVTVGNASEHEQLRASLQADRLYVFDRGYAGYQLFQEILDAGSSFIGRVRDNGVYQIADERPLSAEARAAGVVRDLVVWLGCERRGKPLRQPLRLIEVLTDKKDSQGRPETLLLTSNRLDLDASLIALGYKYRWTIELFFRWFKCVLGCQHLLSQCQNGVAIQVYLALIASLLVSLWTGRKPTKRTLEMIRLYLSGWATETELLAHIRSLEKKAA